MKRSFFLCAALTAATLSFSSCDYRRGPGNETQRYPDSFAEAPDAPTNLDSVNAEQTVTTPQGLGSAAAMSSDTSNTPPTSNNGAMNAPGGPVPPSN